jgi:hypothetical protein
MYNDLLESIIHNLSLKLMDTSEENPLEVYIPLEHDAVGLSTLEMPTITKIYQCPSEGIIYVHFDEDNYDTEFDTLYMADMIQILKELEQ